LHALGDLGAGRTVLALLIDRQGVEVGLDVVLVLPLQSLDLIGEFGRHGRRDEQQQTEAQSQRAKPTTKGPCGR